MNATLLGLGLAAIWLADCSGIGHKPADLPILNTRWMLTSFTDAGGAHGELSKLTLAAAKLILRLPSSVVAARNQEWNAGHEKHLP